MAMKNIKVLEFVLQAYLCFRQMVRLLAFIPCILSTIKQEAGNIYRPLVL